MLKEKLSQIKDQNTNLYEHISNVLTKILLDNPKNAFQLFEDYSLQVKSSNYTFQRHDEFDNAQRPIVTFNPDIANKTLTLVNKINVGTDDEPQDAPQLGYVPNLPEEATLFEWGGIGVDETYKIFKSLQRLALKTQATRLRFWGKVLGRKSDYFIAEGIANSGAEDGELPPEVEPRGSGVNTKSYWATTDILGGEWVELPLVYPQHIAVARQIRYIFTGDLEREVITNPFFFGDAKSPIGREKHLLKAQIVRIAQSTSLVPRGQFKVREGEPREIDPTEEYKLPTLWEVKTLADWAHINQNILKCNRLTIQLPADIGDQDPEALTKQLEAADPYEERLKPISLDKLPNGAPAWKIRIAGDTTDYNPLARVQTAKVNNGVVVIKSLVWPGLCTVYSNKVLQQIYVGYGSKYSDTHFYPKQPQQVQLEVADVPEQPEPNFPKEEKKAAQDD